MALRALLAALLAIALPAVAEWAPTRPVRIVVPFAPGGQPDLVARTLAEPLSKALGQPVLVENRPGAGGNVAAEALAKGAPDGHTLLVATNGPFAVSPALAKSLPYDVGRDFAFVTMIGSSPSLVAVHPSLGAATLAEVVAIAKARPGGLNYASVGKGSVSQLSMAQLSAETGIETVHVPYSGGVQAVAALLAGDVQLLSLVPTALIPHVAAGRLRIVAQTGATRSPLVPDVPTVAESGFPGFEAPVWMALVVPARTPPEAVKRLHAELARIIRAPEMKERLWDRQWIDPAGSTPEETARVVREETAKWARIGRALGIALE